MKLLTILAPLALALVLCTPSYAEGLQGFPAPPQVRQIGEAQGQLIGRTMTSATVYQKGQLTAIEFSYEKGLTLGLIQTTPQVIQIALGMIEPDPGHLSVTLLSELPNGQIVGLAITQAGVKDDQPLAGLTPKQVRGILDAFEQVAGNGGGGQSQLMAASADWRATGAEHSVGCTLIEETASTKGTFNAYAQLFRTSFSFAQGYEVRTTATGDMEARRDASAHPKGVNHVGVRRHQRGGGVITIGYTTPNAHAMENYLREVLLAVDEGQRASVLRGAQPRTGPFHDPLPGMPIEAAGGLGKAVEQAGQ